MSRTYRQPHEDEDRQVQLVCLPLANHDPLSLVRTSIARAGATDDAFDRRNVDDGVWSEVVELVLERGCPPAKAVSIVTGCPVPRLARPRLVA